MNCFFRRDGNALQTPQKKNFQAVKKSVEKNFKKVQISM